MLTDYDKSLSFFNEASRVYKSAGIMGGIKAMQGNIFTLNVIWNKVNEDELESFLNSQTDTYKESGLGMYFQSLISNNTETLYEAMTKCLKSGDNMLATLPRNELLRQGENQFIIKRFNDLAITA